MTCAEYSEMDSAGQAEAFETMGDRETLRDEAAGADANGDTNASSATNELGEPGNGHGRHVQG